MTCAYFVYFHLYVRKNVDILAVKKNLDCFHCFLLFSLGSWSWSPMRYLSFIQRLNFKEKQYWMQQNVFIKLPHFLHQIFMISVQIDPHIFYEICTSFGFSWRRKSIFVPGKQANLVKTASGPAFDVCCHEKSTKLLSIQKFPSLGLEFTLIEDIIPSARICNSFSARPSVCHKNLNFSQMVKWIFPELLGVLLTT